MSDGMTRTDMAPKEMYVLYYNQPTIKGGRTVAGDTWYAAKRPGDGGFDWEYTKDPSRAGKFSKHWLQRWVKLHGRVSGWRISSPEVVIRVEEKPMQCGACARIGSFGSGPMAHSPGCQNQ